MSRLPRGQRAWATLVEAVGALDDRLERHYLEVKSDVDLNTKTDQAKIAKFILGADNRDPDRAASYFDGYAVMILGVGSGQITGIGSFEAKDLESAVQRYIGVNGPRWDFERIPTVDSDKDVICIIVDPPRADEVATCHRDGDGLRGGALYIRADGQTREARGDEVRVLLARANASGPKLDLEVLISGEVSLASCSDTPFVDYANYHSARLRDVRARAERAERDEKRRRQGTPNWPLNYTVPIVSPSVFSPYRKDENRTGEEYEGQIEAWSAKVIAAKESTVDRALGIVSPRNFVIVRNQSKRFLEDVEVNIHLDGEVRAVAVLSQSDDPREDVPRMPRPWGPWEQDPLAGFNNIALPARAMPINYPSNTVEFRNGGSVTLTFTVGDLRPLESYETDDDEFTLVLLEGGDEELVYGRWTVTARGMHDVFQGEIQVPIVKLENIERGIRALLKLENPDDDGQA